MSLSGEALKKYREAGRIAAEVRGEMRKYVKEGMPIIDVCETAESLIKELGGKPAFPCNVSINEIAAHYTSPPNDEKIIPKGAIVKVDIGVHIDGYLTDTATTVCFNPQYRDMVRTAEEALHKGIEIIRDGLSTSKFGATIEKVIRERGFKPVSNLTGHMISRFLVHAGKSLPNVSHMFGFKLKKGQVFAIEPFVTEIDSVGKVREGKIVTIFRFNKKKSLKDLYSKKLFSFIEKNFRTLPFCERWLKNVVPKQHFSKAFQNLLSSKCLFGYPIFIEASNKMVAQAEHTVIIKENGCEVLTEL